MSFFSPALGSPSLHLSHVHAMVYSFQAYYKLGGQLVITLGFGIRRQQKSLQFFKHVAVLILSSQLFLRSFHGYVAIGGHWAT